ncbi:hypothetical protein GCM10027085_64230 [Spirosoma aerophilum]
MQLEIRYDLINTRPGDSVYFSVLSRLRGTLQVSPEFVRGDIGLRITAGSDRRIIWNARANGYPLNEEIQARVFVKTGVADMPPATAAEPVVLQKPTPSAPAPKPAAPEAVPAKAPVTESKVVSAAPPAAAQKSKPAQPKRSVFAADPVVEEPAPTGTSAQASPLTPAPVDDPQPRKRRYNGPAWALVSAVAPGIGNIFVQTPKPKIGLRPLVTVGCYGLLIYGFMERQKAQDEYRIYEQQKNMAAGEPYYQTANDHHHRYFLATRGAVIVAAADVVLTFIKGLHNSKLNQERRQNQPLSLRPGLQAGQPTAVVRYSF